MQMINMHQLSLGKGKINRFAEVFESNWTGKGKLVDDFEEWAISSVCANRSKLVLCGMNLRTLNN